MNYRFPADGEYMVTYNEYRYITDIDYLLPFNIHFILKSCIFDIFCNVSAYLLNAYIFYNYIEGVQLL